MDKKNVLRAGAAFMLGAFIMGSAVPAMAADNVTVSNKQMVKVKNWSKEKQSSPMSRNIYRASMADVLEELSTVKADDIKAELKDGKSLLTIAEENGIDKETIKAKLMEREKEKLKALLEEEKIDQEKYNYCIENVEEKAIDIVERIGTTKIGEFKGEVRSKQVNMFRGGMNLVDLLAALGAVEADDIKAELKDGKSLLTIAEENGIDKETIKAKLMETEKEALKEVLEEGKISQEKYDLMISNLDQRIQNLIDKMDNGIRENYGRNGQFKRPGRIINKY